MPDPEAAGEGEALAPAVDRLWEDWDTPPRVPASPVLHLDGYDGPLDLLLDLAERQRLDLGRLSMAELAAQFVAAMEVYAGRVPVERRAEWLNVASRLVLLRSRLLFPASSEAAAEAERAAKSELRRVEELEAMRAAAAWLQARPRLRVDVFARPAPPALPREGGYVALLEACLVVLRGKAGRSEAVPVYQPMLLQFWRTSDALRRIRAVLAERPEGGELGVFLPILGDGEPDRSLTARAAVARTFAVGLELMRAGEVALRQEEEFGPIHFVGCPALEALQISP